MHHDSNLTAQRPSFVTHLECAMTGERYEPVNLCRPQLGSSASDGAPFIAV